MGHQQLAFSDIWVPQCSACNLKLERFENISANSLMLLLSRGRVSAIPLEPGQTFVTVTMWRMKQRGCL